MTGKDKAPTASTPTAPEQTISALGEFALIERITGVIGTSHAGRQESVIVGNGDDAAVVAVRGGEVVIATDSLVQGRHFRLEWSSGQDIGTKAVARSCADIAAMGGVCTAVVVALCAPSSTPIDLIEAIAAGVRDEAARAGAVVVGGDTTQADQLLLTVTAIGEMAGLTPVRRDGARAGDVVAVLGELGRSHAGWQLLDHGANTDDPLVIAHLRPRPDYAAGRAMAAAGANALIDISDGLMGDLAHIAAASHVAIDIESNCIPLGTGVTLDDALAGGEDHVFVATFPPEAALPDGAVVIGRCVEPGGRPIVTVDARIGPSSWEHFTDDTEGHGL